MTGPYRFLEDIMRAFLVRGLIAIAGLLIGLGLYAQPALAQPETITIAAANRVARKRRKGVNRPSACNVRQSSHSGRLAGSVNAAAKAGDRGVDECASVLAV